MKLNEIKTKKIFDDEPEQRLFDVELKRVQDLCIKYDIKKFTVNPDKTVTVNGPVSFFENNFDKIPIKFKHIAGHLLIIECNNLKTLEGCPPIVDGDLVIRANRNLKSLKGGPTDVSSFECVRNHLLGSLEFMPEKIKENIEIINCINIKSLVKLPEKVHNLTLDSLEIDSLKNTPKIVTGDFVFTDCHNVTTYDDMPVQIDGLLDIEDQNFDIPELKHYLKFFKIKNLRRINCDYPKVQNIMNKHLSSSERSIIECQEELIDAGLKDFARLK